MEKSLNSVSMPTGLSSSCFLPIHTSLGGVGYDLNNIRVSVGNSLAVQWLGLCTFTAEGTGSIPGRGTKIPQAAQCSQK